VKTVLNILIPVYKYNSDVKKLLAQLGTSFSYPVKFIICLNGSYEVNRSLEVFELAKLKRFHEVIIKWEPSGMPIGYYRESLRRWALEYPAHWNLFLDADDSLEMETLKNFPISSKQDVIVYKFNDPGNPFINSETEVPFSTMVFYQDYALSSTAFAAMRRMEDQMFNMQLCRAGFNFIRKSETLVHITKDPESITRKPGHVSMQSVFTEAKIAQSTYKIPEISYRYLPHGTSHETILDWIAEENYNILKVLMVDREWHKSVPFLDTDTQVLLYAIDGYEEGDLDVVRASEEAGRRNQAEPAR
jgi:hypothetical protein